MGEAIGRPPEPCWNCGYDRSGLGRDRACPECGKNPPISDDMIDWQAVGRRRGRLIFAVALGILAVMVLGFCSGLWQALAGRMP